MKYIKYSILFLLIVILKLNAQNTQIAFPVERAQVLCVYTLSYQPDSTNIERRVESMRLLIGKTTSTFQSENGFRRDSIINSMADTPDNQENTQILMNKLSATPSTKLDFQVFKYRSSNRIFCYDKIGAKLYKYDDRFPNDIWKVTTKKAKISGYSCQKALLNFRGREYEAWFSNEIPISDGPYKFFGLPGLIVKLYDVRKQYIFELIKLKQFKSGPIITLPKQAAVANRVTLQQGKRNYYANLAGTVSDITGNQSSVDAQSLERKRIIKKFNNSLEIR